MHIGLTCQQIPPLLGQTIAGPLPGDHFTFLFNESHGGQTGKNRSGQGQAPASQSCQWDKSTVIPIGEGTKGTDLMTGTFHATTSLFN
ncbi:hypothetical protein ATO9_16800 [Pseudooceanicola atlanticus]|uniref:Uncharacterized protein n=1 Tax=Pseudooceanicola atlanticus TaxID=1461694 RepID=A0A0A0EB83_9RHOB|nr:hypothetical protein ATO9_16800 [Pseudooceanicola atlanticus]